MRLNEIAGPGDYRPGDEDNPGSPDYDPRPRGGRTRPSIGRNDHFDYDADERERKAAANRKQFTFTTKSASGEYNGKPYNVVRTITGPSAGIVFKVNSDVDHHTNIYHKFAGSDLVNHDDGTSTANIYIQADDGSLLKRN